MSRPTPLEVQDALFAHPLRVTTYVAAVLAAVAFLAPWEVAPDRIVWTWDLWRGREAFFLVPVAGGVALAVAAGLEQMPGAAVAGASIVLGATWWLTGADDFEPLWRLLGGGADVRRAAVATAVLLLLGALAWRLALHRTLAGRAVLGLAVVGLAAVLFVPLGEDGGSVFRTAVLARFSVGEPAAIAAALPVGLVLLAALLALAGLPPTARGTGGFSAIARAAFHLAAVSAACAALLPAMASLPDRGDLSYAAFAAPLKLAALWWCALAWTGSGAGSLAAAVEAYVRRDPISAGRPAAGRCGPGLPPPGRPIVRGEPVFVPPATSGGAVEPRPPDLSPLPPPPGIGLPDAVPGDLHAKEPSEVVEIPAQHVLPILDTTPTPAAPGTTTPVSSKAPSPASPKVPSLPPTLEPVRPAPRAGIRTIVGMPSVIPGLRSVGTEATPVPRPDQSGRTGDTSLGLPVTSPRPPSASARPPEDSGLRLWPPPVENRAARCDGETRVVRVQVLREVVLDGAEKDRRMPAAPAIPPLGTAPSPAPVAGPAGGADEAIRFRVSVLQRRLARGELTPEEYQRRIDELRRPPRS